MISNFMFLPNGLMKVVLKYPTSEDRTDAHSVGLHSTIPLHFLVCFRNSTFIELATP